MDNIILSAFCLGLTAILGWILLSVLSNLRTRKIIKVQADLQAKLLDKFSTTAELVEYLDSAAGERFLKSATIEHSNPYGRILGALQVGIIVTILGLGFLYLDGQVTEMQPGFVVLGVLSVALGCGFLISGGAAFVLSKWWGLINGHKPTPAGDDLPS